MEMRLRVKKHKRGFGLSLPSTNGKVVYNAETFTQKPAVFKNIAATMKFFGAKATVLMQDDSLVEPAVYKLSLQAGKLKVQRTDIKCKK